MSKEKFLDALVDDSLDDDWLTKQTGPAAVAAAAAAFSNKPRRKNNNKTAPAPLPKKTLFYEDSSDAHIAQPIREKQPSVMDSPGPKPHPPIKVNTNRILDELDKFSSSLSPSSIAPVVTDDESAIEEIPRGSPEKVKPSERILDSSRPYETISPSHSKQVRFQRNFNWNVDVDDTELRPWEFRRLIRRNFISKLPETAKVVPWKKPSKGLVHALMQLLEIDSKVALEDVFVKYDDEIKNVTFNKRKEIKKIHALKEKLMHDILTKIRSRLKLSAIPTKLNGHDIDSEYIFAKRKFIQGKYSQEKDKNKKLRDELKSKREELEQLKMETLAAQEPQPNNNDHDLLDKLQETLHPTLQRLSLIHI